MISYTANSLVSVNETYTLKSTFVGCDYILYVSGVFGGATATFGYIDGSDNFAPFRNSSNEILTATSSSGYFVVAPPSQLVAIQLSSTSNTTSVRFDIARRQG
jgi:hypothetical protein